MNPSTNTIAANISGNAATATKLATEKTISLTGDVTGSASFDGSTNISITATVADSSHNHNASNITAGTIAAARLPAATTSAQGAMSAADKTKLDATNVAYATCSTAAATVAKVITTSGNDNWVLKTGGIIVVKFSATNTAQNPTFNVDGTGAKRVWYDTALLGTSSLGYAGTANRPMIYMYDGTQYVFLGWSYDANTTYSNASLGQCYATCSTAAATAAKTAAMSSYTLTTGGIVSVKFANAVPANATLNINSKGAKAIYYRGAAITDNVIKAGDTATFIYNTQYHLLAVDSAAAALKSHPDEVAGNTPSLTTVPLNADTLGGVNAADYALKFANWNDAEKIALADYVISRISNARGVGF
ncbi:MAG: hypothetical protein J6K74_06505 [Marinifilaceae bacterium]|nr:hypothetical protein [Marinifilaceae bacterium]